VINLKKNSLSDYSDIRNSQRIIQSNMSCRFDNNATLFPIHELSAHGFSFLCPTKLCFFRQGAIFNKLSILNIDKMEIISAAGTVVHTSQFDLKNMRVGVLFHKKQHDYQIDILSSRTLIQKALGELLLKEFSISIKSILLN